ncbi:hypothetical protein LSH36_1107g00033 [Paralvinella palmiformis]|uniref:Uncharacterized protein n=1 Tax=Paralvinella palmiformis TaxID=53620 RepID=A0AAD9IW28_9ANNE|nr:hypothetical protein LSH36_1107g00033 [Paralvinella palmiformis]
MASLVRCRSSLVRLVLLKKPLTVAPVSSASIHAWNKDWQPGPYPRTAKERAAAAKKYGLLPEDYEPYPDDGMGYGDYPKLPPVPTIRKSQYEQYDLPYLRRNYGETMSVDADALREDWLDPELPKHMHAGSSRYMLLWFTAVVGMISVLFVLSDPYPLRLNVMPKQYPYQGKKHYTFDPVED